MSLYCPKCGVWAYRNHKCDIMSLIPIKAQMRGIVDRLYYLGFDMLSASCFSHPVDGSLYGYSIVMDVVFKKEFSTFLLGDLPVGWVWYTETITDDHMPLMALGYSEIYMWLGVETVEQRIKQITEEFESFLDTRDKLALEAIRLLTAL